MELSGYIVLLVLLRNVLGLDLAPSADFCNALSHSANKLGVLTPHPTPVVDEDCLQFDAPCCSLSWNVDQLVRNGLPRPLMNLIPRLIPTVT